jgi:hypothetical protein
MILQERAQKLTEQHLSELQVVHEKMEKRIQNYERSLRGKMDTICQKLSEINHCKEVK